MIEKQPLGAGFGTIVLALGAGLLAGACVRAKPPTDPGFVAADPVFDAGRDLKVNDTGRADAADGSIPVPATGTDLDAGADRAGDLPHSGPLTGNDDDAAATASDVAAPVTDTAGVDRAPPADGPAAGSDAGDPLRRGLAAFWPFDEGMGLLAGDATLRGNQATLRNGVAWKPSPVPQLGARAGDFAIELDGSDDYLDVPAAKLPTLAANKSIAFWFAVRPDAPAPMGGGTQRTCLALLDADAGTGLQIGFDRDRPAAWNTGQNQGFVVAPTVPGPGVHHWGYTFDGTVHRLYVDGRSVSTSTVRPAQAAVATLLIGTYEPPKEMCAGQLDDLRIYDRALAASEIALLAVRP